MTVFSYCASLREQYLDQPFEVSLETFAKCNADCEFCPYSSMDRLGERMDDSLIDALVDEMSGFKLPFGFSPFKVNEPLLDKRVLPLLRRMNRDVPMAHLRLFSNGTTITPNNIAQIAELKQVHHLWISLNSVDQAEYQRVMKLDFERTARNLDALHKMDDFPHPVMLSTVGYPNETFRRYCFDRWPKFESMAIKRVAWLGFTKAQDMEVPNDPCSRWFEMSICADGVVSLCCMDGTGEYAIGNVKTHSLLDIYNSPAWRERREGLWSRHRVHPCSTCTY